MQRTCIPVYSGYSPFRLRKSHNYRPVDDADADADADAVVVVVVVVYVVVVKRREEKRREEKSKSKKLRQSHPETTQRKRNEHIA